MIINNFQIKLNFYNAETINTDTYLPNKESSI